MIQWVKNRWIELRIGTSSYLAYVYSFASLVLLISLRFTNTQPIEFVGLAAVLIGLGIIAGHFHLKWQQTTDVRKQYDWMIEEIVRRVKEEK